MRATVLLLLLTLTLTLTLTYGNIDHHDHLGNVGQAASHHVLNNAREQHHDTQNIKRNIQDQDNLEERIKESIIKKASLEGNDGDDDDANVNQDEEDLEKSFSNGFIASTSMIIISELGDKTFFIAAILAMKHPKMLIFVAAFIALAGMHIFSCIVGVALPALLPKKYTHMLSTLLFLVFGFRLLYEAYHKESNPSGPSEEFEEAQEDLQRQNENKYDLDKGKNKKKNLQQQIFLTTLSMTFFAEWGDRSQIATFALAAAYNGYGVCVGGILGHGLCTGIAVLGGELLSTKISERTVSFLGGVLFLMFGLHSMFFE